MLTCRMIALKLFLSTPSARRATDSGVVLATPEVISIHALREEGDAASFALAQCPKYFYPRPPRGGRQIDNAFLGISDEISIHALREEGDPAVAAAYMSCT